MYVSEPFRRAVPEIKAILFDLDGTLLDTDDIAVERLERRLRPVLRARSTAAARWLLMKAESPGNWLVTGLDRLGQDVRFMSLTDRLRRRRGVYPAHEFRLIPGTAAALETLAKRYRLGLVTTRSRYHIDAFLAGFPDLAPAFAVTCGLQDTLRLKPHPAPILLAAETLGLPPAACLMVGDTTVDIRAAKRAGAWAAGVLSGFGEEGELRRSGADAILGSVAELGEVMEKGVRSKE